MNDQLPVVIDRLGRWLRQASKSPEAHEVHRLRTSVRRIEVLLGRRLQQDEKLERQLRQLRRRAGRVRDLDVQTEQLRQLHLDSDEGRRALLARMENERKQQVRKLRKRLDYEDRRSMMRRVRAAAKRRAAVARGIVAALPRPERGESSRFPQGVQAVALPGGGARNRG